MIRSTLVLLAFVSAMLFPWPVTVLLALASAASDPLVPLAVGIFADTLYYSPHAGSAPYFTLFGTLGTAVAFFVRSWLKASTIRG
ncbi:MAG: hypothetical protein WAN50_02670 [Minisyncoccia bacterium]